MNTNLHERSVAIPALSSTAGLIRWWLEAVPLTALYCPAPLVLIRVH